MAHRFLKSLNPCCSGQWSRTRLISLILTMGLLVLILVVVDNGLVHPDDWQDEGGVFMS